MKTTQLAYLLVVIITILRYDLRSATVDISTTDLSNWRVTAGGAVNAAPYSFGTELSISSTGTGIGTFVSGGSFGAFSGFWLANYTFFLPSDAANISLTFSNLYADDRVVLNLDGDPIAATGIDYLGNYASSSMVLTDGGPEQPYTFSGPVGTISGTVGGGFVLGGMNILQGIVNNTHTGVHGPDEPIYDGTSNDGTHFGLLGAITYTVPEPSVMALAVVGLFLAFGTGHRSK